MTNNRINACVLERAIRAHDFNFFQRGFMDADMAFMDDCVQVQREAYGISSDGQDAIRRAARWAEEGVILCLQHALVAATEWSGQSVTGAMILARIYAKVLGEDVVLAISDGPAPLSIPQSDNVLYNDLFGEVFIRGEGIVDCFDEIDITKVPEEYRRIAISLIEKTAKIREILPQGCAPRGVVIA